MASLNKDLARSRRAKYSPDAAADVSNWLSSALGEPLPKGDLMDVLKDGTILCRLVSLLDGVNLKPKKSAMPFVQMENIAQFLAAITNPPVSLQPHDRFLTVDLFEKKDPAQVLQCLGAFSRVAHNLQPAAFPDTVGGLKSALPASSGGATSPTAKEKKSVPVTAWTKPSQEGTTAPAWNVAQYGYMGGASQGNQGIMFGGRRQITATPAAGGLGLSEREKQKKREQEQEERDRLKKQNEAEKEALKRQEADRVQVEAKRAEMRRIADEKARQVVLKREEEDKARKAELQRLDDQRKERARQQEAARQEAARKAEEARKAEAARATEIRRLEEAAAKQAELLRLEEEAAAKEEALRQAAALRLQKEEQLRRAEEEAAMERERELERERQAMEQRRWQEEEARTRFDESARSSVMTASRRLASAQSARSSIATTSAEIELARERERVRQLERELEKAREREKIYEAEKEARRREETERMRREAAEVIRHRTGERAAAAQRTYIQTHLTGDRPMPAHVTRHDRDRESAELEEERRFLQGAWARESVLTPPVTEPTDSRPASLSKSAPRALPTPPRKLPPTPVEVKRQHSWEKGDDETPLVSPTASEEVRADWNRLSFLEREREKERQRQKEWERDQMESQRLAATTSSTAAAAAASEDPYGYADDILDMY
ncbi:hypothetical protein FN846DRAFT_501965 [Sphaerosporella brunnea]|uniref:Calponin-homology (CH) domain-containing protein n=1 Tax=Sphaerosporella brunnea TaxID=1250544 RepID=A0A5J5EFH2_9PEZI|nr:hypothetical protein FN846DRAFT_501965 [Sphaerosporella brunnea]